MRAHTSTWHCHIFRMEKKIEHQTFQIEKLCENITRFCHGQSRIGNREKTKRKKMQTHQIQINGTEGNSQNQMEIRKKKTTKIVSRHIIEMCVPVFGHQNIFSK